MKFKSQVELEKLDNSSVDTDKFLVSDSNIVKYRTGSEVLSDIGGQPLLTNPITGTGNYWRIPKFNSLSTLVNSIMYDTGASVGIDTTTPFLKFTVKGSWAEVGTDGDDIIIRKPNYTGGVWARKMMDFQEYTGTSYTQFGAFGSNNTFTYGYIGSAYNNPVLTWYPTKYAAFHSRLAVGTTAPDCEFHVKSLSTLGSTVGDKLLMSRKETSTGNQAKIDEWSFRKANGSNWLTYVSHNSISVDGSYDRPGIDTKTFWERDPLNGIHHFGNSSNYTMTINGGNNCVGIGNNIAPSYPLHVLNNVSGTSIYANANIVAYSDQSVKENIRPIENVIEKIQGSRGVIYDRTDIESKDNIGFIAQELEVNFPELVITNENGTKAVMYQNAVAVLFEAIKEQQKQINELKELINGITN